MTAAGAAVGRRAGSVAVPVARRRRDTTAPGRVWETLWHLDVIGGLTVERTWVKLPSGGYWHHRFRQGTVSLTGAVAVALHHPAAGPDGVRGVPQVLMVHQDRIALGKSMWELPRGGTSHGDTDVVATALRELAEEAGVTPHHGELIGMVHPDSGMVTSVVGVVLAVLDDPQIPWPADGEADKAAWFPLDEVYTMMAEGRLTDGMSLSALMLASNHLGHLQST